MIIRLAFEYINGLGKLKIFQEKIRDYWSVGPEVRVQSINIYF